MTTVSVKSMSKPVAAACALMTSGGLKSKLYSIPSMKFPSMELSRRSSKLASFLFFTAGYNGYAGTACL